MTEAVGRQKAKMRERVLARRDAMPARTRAAKSAEVCKRLEETAEQLLVCRRADVLAGRGFGATGAAVGRAAAGGRASSNIRTHCDPHAANADRNAALPTVALFAPMGSEVDVMPFATWANEHGMRTAFPSMERADETPLQEGRAAVAGADGITTPCAACASDAADVAADSATSPDSESRTKAVMRFRSVPARMLAHGEKPQFMAKPMRANDPHELDRQGFTLVLANAIDMVVVPMVAFDDAGMRLGYGGGNYDRFLPRLSHSTLVVGVAFEEQRVPHVPQEPHDVPLPRIISA